MSDTSEDGEIDYFLDIKHIAQHYHQIIKHMGDVFTSYQQGIDKISSDVRKELLKNT